jgi:hypothetical protein
MRPLQHAKNVPCMEGAWCSAGVHSRMRFRGPHMGYSRSGRGSLLPIEEAERGAPSQTSLSSCTSAGASATTGWANLCHWWWA